MSRSVLFTIGLAAIMMSAFVLSGCGQSAEAAAQGTYELDRERVSDAIQDQIDAMEDSSETMELQMMRGMLGNMSMTLTLKEEGVAELTVSMMGQSETQTGTWSIEGESISITIDENGQEDTIPGTLRDGVLELNPPDDADMPFPLVFNRAEE